MFIFKIKREQAQFTAKNSAQTVHVYIFHNLSIYSCSRKRLEEHAKRHKKVSTQNTN